MTQGRRILAVAGVTLAIVGTSCGGSSSLSPTAPPPPGPVLSSLVVSGWLQPLRVGDTTMLTATGIYSDGSGRLVTAEATWESSNASIATVQAGAVTAMAEGFVAITARLSDKAGSHPLTIEPGKVPPGGLACGIERWAVKTLSDPAASSVDTVRVVPTTIKALNELPTHCGGLPTTRAFSEEFVLYEVVGRIVYVKDEDDRDYHVAVADPADSSYTIVTEVVNTACSGAISSPHRDSMGGTRARFMELLAGRNPSALVGTTVRLRGVGFYDFDHRQIGRSRNCIELHPLTMFERVQ